MKQLVTLSRISALCLAGILAATAARAQDTPSPATEKTAVAPDDSEAAQKPRENAAPEKPVRQVTPVASAPEAEPIKAATAEAKETAAAKATPEKARPIAAPAAAPAAKPAQPEPAAAVVYHDGKGRYCIGGTACPNYCASGDRACTAEFSHVITLDKPTYIAAIQVNAHDNVARTRRSKLIVKVNGKPLRSEPVFRLGSSLSFEANTVGQVITIESAHQMNGFLKGGDEAVIWDIFAYGRAE